MKKTFFVFLTTVALFSSCQTKESYMEDFDKFIEKVQKECADYTEKDWEKADEEFARFTKDAYKEFAEELSVDEKMEIAKYQTAYTAMKAKSGLKSLGKDLGRELKKAGEKLEKAMEE